MSTAAAHNVREFESEVVVLGFGGAGAVAAIAASDAGAAVTVLEKRAFGGGSTRLSSGGIFVPDGPEFANYLEDIWQRKTPRSVIDRFVERAMQLEEYFESIGVAISRWPGNSQDVSPAYPGLGRPSWPKVRDGEMIRVHATAADERPVGPEVWAQMTNNERVHHIGRTYGISLWEQLRARAEERGINIHYETRARRLVTDGAGEVVAVIADHEGEEVTFNARKAVILTTGGFSSNPQMRDTYLSCPFVYAGTNDYAHGDGHAIAQRVGARLWHMQTVCGQIGFKAPEFDQAFQVRATNEAFVWVDKHGRRYTDETSEKLHNTWRSASLFDPDNDLHSGEQWPRVPTYMIFDETMRKEAPLSRDWRPDGDHSWSLDNRDEVERGWIKTGADVAALAAELQMDPSVLESTLDSFNAYSRDGSDLEFGRDPNTMAPIANGPFYALPLVPMLISTHGGPEHDEESRVLGEDGNPIPRLYAAGEVSSIVGWLYEAGSGHAECTVFGRIAGENAAAETPREAGTAPVHARA
jgi:succinate dehydrogenase/fumarate reductase flavoprotein subunit